MISDSLAKVQFLFLIFTLKKYELKQNEWGAIISPYRKIYFVSQKGSVACHKKATQLSQV